MCSFVFFFSSRRRHTRLQGDWSSDVCSSDLPASNPGRRNAYRPNPVRSPSETRDRKSTRLNSSHLVISYAVFCLKKKRHITVPTPIQTHPTTSLPRHWHQRH